MFLFPQYNSICVCIIKLILFYFMTLNLEKPVGFRTNRQPVELVGNGMAIKINKYSK